MTAADQKRAIALELGALPTRLLQAIKRSGLTLSEFSRRIGHDKGEISKLTRAEHDDPKLAGLNANVLVKAAQLGRVRVGWLIAGEPPAVVEGSEPLEATKPLPPPATRARGAAKGRAKLGVTRTHEADTANAERDQERKARGA